MTSLSMLELFSVLFMNDRLCVPGVICVQFISATTAANQITVFCRLSQTEEKMKTIATNFSFFIFVQFWSLVAVISFVLVLLLFFQKKSRQSMKRRTKNRFLRDTETSTRNFSIQVKLESGKFFAVSFSGKILYFSLMICFIICGGFQENLEQAQAHPASGKGTQRQTVCLQEVYLKFP